MRLIPAATALVLAILAFPAGARWSATHEYAVANGTGGAVTAEIVNQGLRTTVPPGGRGSLRTAPFVYANGDSTAFYRLRLTSASGARLCEAVVRAEWTRGSFFCHADAASTCSLTAERTPDLICRFTYSVR